MEAQLVRLMKVMLDNTVKPDYNTDVDSDKMVIDNIMKEAELELSPSARQELITHIGFLQRPF